MTEFDSVALNPGDFLLLRPRGQMTEEAAAGLQSRIPDALKGRVLVVAPDAFDVLTVHPVGPS